MGQRLTMGDGEPDELIGGLSPVANAAPEASRNRFIRSFAWITAVAAVSSAGIWATHHYGWIPEKWDPLDWSKPAAVQTTEPQGNGLLKPAPGEEGAEVPLVKKAPGDE